MESYSVIVAPGADRDLGEIFEYIAVQLQAPDAAGRLIEKIYTVLRSLSSMPLRHPLSKDNFLAKQGFHTFMVESHLIFYVVDEVSKDVIVHRALYAKRNYAALFVPEVGDAPGHTRD
jgi:plasmid stabilization system protein ParE